MGIVTVFVVATLTFTAMHLVPGDPLLEERVMSKEVRANLEAKYGLDKPVMIQYAVFLKNLLHGDFGLSFIQKNRSVNDIIKGHFPISALLGILSLLFALLFGIIFGALAALYKNRPVDTIIGALILLGFSIPGFVVAAFGQLAIIEINEHFQKSILSIGGAASISDLIIPAIFLGLSTMSSLTNFMRSSMLEVISADYIKTAKIKGLSSMYILLRHQLKNSILPIVTFIGPAIAAITTGTFVIESVFAIPGLGRYFVQAVQQLDYTVIMGLTVFYGSYLVLIMIAVDILYGFIDPRIRIGEKTQ